jgi:glycine/D-amino acid oxidase-like deaminating enzyme
MLILSRNARAVEPIGTKGWVLSACSGHGFKLGPMVGDRLARTLLGEFLPAETTRYLAGLGV